MISKLTFRIPKSFLQSLIATIKTLLDTHIMDQIERSEEDIENCRIRNVRDFLKEL
ncbi:MAG: hypothetical protein AMDU5_GPLC00015G0015 [Thermoplasmatales archaeon Gpl]|nr:MAG: hypothetical protein AMDU5_GPLC00015G0015 [Thermoplasmatales archaeon Gpl]